MKRVSIALQDQVFFLSGELNAANVMALFSTSVQQMEQCEQLLFDFSQLKSSDSTGLALIIEWLKYAKYHQKQIKFHHLSADLLSIARVSGMDQWLTRSSL
jgi:phospholipid transport system transporter-binding protein